MLYDKRYQVFVSSTLADLKEERQTVMQVLLESDCIPAGMELFPASGELWELIKGVIEDSDYYVLIVAGRYGSITSEGISYTEKEFDHALRVGKPILAFLHEKPEEIPAGKTELDAEARSKLASFRARVETGRHCRYWLNPDDLGGKVSRSINQEIKRNPKEGWVRGRFAADDKLIAELANLRAENDRLKSAQQAAQIISPEEAGEFASGSDLYELNGLFEVGDPKVSVDWQISVSWEELFRILGPSLLVSVEERNIHPLLSRSIQEKYLMQILSEHENIERRDIKSFAVSQNDFNQIKLQFMALGLISRKELRDADGTTHLFWSLTPLGETKLVKENAIRRTKASRP